MEFIAEHRSLITLAILDEMLHATTAIVMLVALWPVPRLQRSTIIAALVGAVLIDLDHLPGMLGYSVVSTRQGRPVTHSLVTIIAVVLLALMLRDRTRLGVLAIAFGVATHLFRDMATGGVPMTWPVSSKEVDIAAGTYFLFLVSCVMLAVVMLMTGVRRLLWTASEPITNPRPECRPGEL